VGCEYIEAWARKKREGLMAEITDVAQWMRDTFEDEIQYKIEILDELLDIIEKNKEGKE